MDPFGRRAGTTAPHDVASMADPQPVADIAGAVQQLLYLVVAFLLVLLNGFFVAAEFAIVKVRATRIEELAQKGRWRASVARNVVTRLDAYLSATQLGITIASLGLGWIGEPAVARLIEPLLSNLGVASPGTVHVVSFAIAFSLIAFLHIVLGELAPKSLAIRLPEATSLWVAAPLRLFYWVMFPAIWILNGTANAILSWVGIDPASGVDHVHSGAELRMIVQSSHEEGALNATEMALFHNVLDFSERRVGEIMVPRLDMVCLYTQNTLDENLAIIRENLHTRYPLAAREKDEIVGLIHVKDLLRLLADDDGADIRTIERPVLYVPSAVTIDHLLKTFQRERRHIAIVVDEYGGVAGLVTLEDVLEELVGPILDEFDTDEILGAALRRGATDFVLEAGRPLTEVARALEFEVEDDEEVNTIGGYVLKLLGHVPDVGKSLAIGRYRVEVVAMDGLRITKLRFRRSAAGDGRAAEAPAEQ
jgi:CBS domain containing-hemolysin-like protein